MHDDLPQTLGPYTLVEFLGRGGMAEVYRARRDGPGGFVKDLALKRILPQYSKNKQLVQRFMDEARIAGALVHGNVVQVSDLGYLDGEYFIVMEYIDGLSLATVLDRCLALRLPVPPPIVAYVGAEVCSALAYAHGLTDAQARRIEVVHRDVSPQNVLLSYAGDVKLGDFGIAKAADSLIQTEAGLRVGKTSYMSPEQAAGEALDGRSDLFAVAVTLWEALTLRPLLPRGDAEQTIRALASCHFPPPSKYERDVPRELESVLLRALSRKREKRFPDGDSMARCLRAYVHAGAPGFGRADLVAYLKWLQPGGSRPSSLGPPIPVLSSVAGIKRSASGLRRWWPWWVLVCAPLVGAAVGAGTFLSLPLVAGTGPQEPAAEPSRAKPAERPLGHPPPRQVPPNRGDAGPAAPSVPSPSPASDHSAPAADESLPAERPAPARRRRESSPRQRRKPD